MAEKKVNRSMVSVGQNWTCPYCNSSQVIAEKRLEQDLNRIYAQGWEKGAAGYYLEAIICTNNACKKLSLEFHLLHRGQDMPQSSKFEVKGTFQKWRLLPASYAKPQPDIIPEVLLRDYEEACAIRDLSPKASATLTRRCIQGIIRDFCGINTKDNRLISEIKELRKQVDEGRAPQGVQLDTVDAIDDVRQIGNIGAHMEADINVIVEVDPGEAQILIELTELLFEEWYVERDKRTKKIKKLHEISEAKKSAK